MSYSRISKRAVTLVLSAAVGLGFLTPAERVDAGPDAKSIMSKVAQTRQLAGSEAVVKMSIIDKGGQSRVRQLSLATKQFGDAEKRIYRFMAPADVKGTGVLVFDYETKDDDMWVYLPAMRKTRRIVSSQRSKSFMGSEFSYADLNAPSLKDYDYKLVKSENAGGEDCHVIEITPKNDGVAEAEGYSKKLYWVSKSRNVIRKGLYFDLDGKELKELTTSDIVKLDPKNDRYRAKKLEMVNKVNGRRSVFETEKIQFSPKAKDEYFTTAYLEKT